MGEPTTSRFCQRVSHCSDQPSLEPSIRNFLKRQGTPCREIGLILHSLAPGNLPLGSAGSMQLRTVNGSPGGWENFVDYRRRRNGKEHAVAEWTIVSMRGATILRLPFRTSMENGRGLAGWANRVRIPTVSSIWATTSMSGAATGSAPNITHSLRRQILPGPIPEHAESPGVAHGDTS